MEKIWYRKKYRYRYRKYLVPEKSIEFRLEFWVPSHTAASTVHSHCGGNQPLATIDPPRPTLTISYAPNIYESNVGCLDFSWETGRCGRPLTQYCKPCQSLWPTATHKPPTRCTVWVSGQFSATNWLILILNIIFKVRSLDWETYSWIDIRIENSPGQHWRIQFRLQGFLLSSGFYTPEQGGQYKSLNYRFFAWESKG